MLPHLVSTEWLINFVIGGILNLVPSIIVYRCTCKVNFTFKNSPEMIIFLPEFYWLVLFPSSFSDQDLLFQCSCPDNCRVLHLQFTHRNCLHAIATVASDRVASSTHHTNVVEPMDTTAAGSSSSVTVGFQGSSLPAFQQMPVLSSLQPTTILPFDWCNLIKFFMNLSSNSLASFNIIIMTLYYSDNYCLICVSSGIGYLWL